MNGRVRRACYSARKRAENGDLPYDLTVEWALEQVEAQGGRCAYTGWELEVEAEGKCSFGTGKPRALSIDRVDPTQGYTQDNCRIVCWQVNLIKRDLSLEHFKELCSAVARNVE